MVDYKPALGSSNISTKEIFREGGKKFVNRLLVGFRTGEVIGFSYFKYREQTKFLGEFDTREGVKIRAFVLMMSKNVYVAYALYFESFDDYIGIAGEIDVVDLPDEIKIPNQFENSLALNSSELVSIISCYFSVFVGGEWVRVFEEIFNRLIDVTEEYIKKQNFIKVFFPLVGNHLDLFKRKIFREKLEDVFLGKSSQIGLVLYVDGHCHSPSHFEEFLKSRGFNNISIRLYKKRVEGADLIRLDYLMYIFLTNKTIISLLIDYFSQNRVINHLLRVSIFERKLTHTFVYFFRFLDDEQAEKDKLQSIRDVCLLQWQSFLINGRNRLKNRYRRYKESPKIKKPYQIVLSLYESLIKEWVKRKELFLKNSIDIWEELWNTDLEVHFVSSTG